MVREAKVFASVVLAALLPLHAMLYVDVRIVHRGSLEYGARVKTGRGAISTSVIDARYIAPDNEHSGGGSARRGTRRTGGRSSRRHPLDWLLLTILIVALAALEMSVKTEYYESRYYLPSLALLAVGAARAVEVLPVRYLRFVVVGACVFALVSATMAHTQVQRWATADQQSDVSRQRPTRGNERRLPFVERGRRPRAHGMSIGVLGEIRAGPSRLLRHGAPCASWPIDERNATGCLCAGGRNDRRHWPFLGTDQVELVR